MTNFFVDTDILVDLLKETTPKGAEEWINHLDVPALYITQQVVRELLDGVRNKEELLIVDRLLAKFERVYHSPEDEIKAEELQRRFMLSHNVGPGDTLIAATVMRHNGVLYTLNEKHFRAIPDLSYEVPYRKS